MRTGLGASSSTDDESESDYFAEKLERMERAKRIKKVASPLEEMFAEMEALGRLKAMDTW